MTLPALIAAGLADSKLLFEKGVFSLQKKERQAGILKYFGKNYPAALVNYFNNCAEPDLVRDMARCLSFLTTHKRYYATTKLFLALQETVFVGLFEETDYAGESAVQQILQTVQKDTAEKRTLYAQACAAESNTPVVRIQTAAPLSPEDTLKIRRHFALQQECSFPVFTVDTTLLGGMRIFKNGRLFDRSLAERLTVFRSPVTHN